MKKVFFFFAVFSAGAVQAETLGLWHFQDGAYGENVGTAVSAVQSPDMDAIGATVGGGKLPIYTNEIAGSAVWAGKTGGLLAADNTSSVWVADNAYLQGGKDGGYICVKNAAGLFQSPTNTDFIRPFTLEMFTRITQWSNQWTDVFGLTRRDGNTSFALQMQGNSSRNLQIRQDLNPLGSSNGTPGFNNGYAVGYTNLQNGDWHHIAFCYDGNRAIKFYIDYQQLASFSISTNLQFDASNAELHLGWANSNVGKPMNAFIDEARVSDAVLEPANFLRVSKKGWKDRLYLMADAAAGSMLTSLKDSYANSTSMTEIVPTALVAASSSNRQLFLQDGASVWPLPMAASFMAASNSVLTIPHTDLYYLENGAFTAECFVKPAGAQGAATLMGHGNSWKLGTDASGRLALTVGANAAQTLTETALDADAWHHVALTYSQDAAGTLTVWLDRTQIATLPGATLAQSTADSVFGSGFTGLVTGLRISQGVLPKARFLTFTVYPQDSALAYWTFDESSTNGQPVSRTLGTVHSVDCATALQGQGTTFPANSSDIFLPHFLSDVCGPAIWNSSTYQMLNVENTRSICFTNQNAATTNNSTYGSCVQMPNASNVTSQNFTVEIFAKVNKVIEYSQLIAKHRIDSLTTWMIDLNPNGTPRLRFDLMDSVTNYSQNGQTWNITLGCGKTIADGAWHHVAFTFQQDPTGTVTAANTVKLYVDYELASSRTLFTNMVYDPAPIRLGAGNGRAFDGLLDEPRITDAVLTPEHFIRIFTPRAEVKGLWLMEGASGKESLDSSVPYLTGSVSYGVTNCADLPPHTVRLESGTWHKSMANSAGFDGTGAVSIPCAAVVGVTNFTVEALVKGSGTVCCKKRAFGKSWAIETADDGTARVRFDTCAKDASWPTGVTTEWLTSSAKLADHAWHHVAVTFDSVSNTATLYVDYKQAGSKTLSAPLYLDTGNLFLGEGWTGNLLGVRFYDKILPVSLFLKAVPPKGTVVMLI